MVSLSSGLTLSRFGTAFDATNVAGAPPDAIHLHESINPKVEMQLVRAGAEFDALQTEWDALFARAGRSEQMFQTHAWLWHWSNHFLAKDHASLAIVTLRRSGRLVGVLPMVVTRVAGLWQLEFMGAPVSQYGDAVIEDMPARNHVLIEALRFAIRETRASVVRLAKVREDAAIATAITRLGALVTGSEHAPFIDIAKSTSFEAYEQRFSNKARKNRRRLERRLAEHGEITFEADLAGSTAVGASHAALTLKRAWLKARGQISKAFADPRTDAFFADVCAGETLPCGAQVSLLRSGGRIANAAIVITCKGRQALHVLSLGLPFEKYAPGLLHVEKLVQRAFAVGATTFDFMAPRHDYKLEWTDASTRVDDFVLPQTLAGRMYARVYLQFVRETLKAALKSRPAWLKRPLSFLQRAVAAVRR